MICRVVSCVTILLLPWKPGLVIICHVTATPLQKVPNEMMCCLNNAPNKDGGWVGGG